MFVPQRLGGFSSRARRKGLGEGVVQFRCNSLKKLVSEKEMKGNERSFTVSRAYFRRAGASKIGFENPGSRHFAWPASVRSLRRPLRGGDVAHERNQQRGDDEGDHDGPKGVGVGHGRRLAVGEPPELLERGGMPALRAAGERGVA